MRFKAQGPRCLKQNLLKTSRKAGHRVSVRICYYDFRNNDRSVHTDQAVFKADDLFLQAISLFDDSWDEGEAVRLIGISVGDFLSEDQIYTQIGLFDEPEDRSEETASILSDLNRLAGTKSFVIISCVKNKYKFSYNKNCDILLMPVPYLHPL